MRGYSGRCVSVHAMSARGHAVYTYVLPAQTRDASPRSHKFTQRPLALHWQGPALAGT